MLDLSTVIESLTGDVQMDVIERFLKYVTFETTSNEESGTVPSSVKELILADFLVEELKSVGVADAMRDSFGYVYGHIPATDGCEESPKIGLIAHMDTSPDVSGANVKPQIITFDGTNAPMISDKYIGQELIVTDRTTLLGADDKAGIAEIIGACDALNNNSAIRHGEVCICFTPDEEIGCGADHFDYSRFGADFAYTVDGDEVGSLECENFNAAAVDITVHGVNTHPGSAKGKMKNAALYLAEFIGMLPSHEAPSHTEGREGFYHVADICGNETEARAHMLIRDHDRTLFERRKEFITRTVDFLNAKYGEGTVEVSIKDSYYNMIEIISKHPEIVERAKNAMLKADVEPNIVPIRGGTDGARLSFEGLPCPNLSTGGMNFHSIYEAIPVAALPKMVGVLINIVSAQ